MAAASIHLTCFCGAISTPVTPAPFLPPRFPYATSLCHCNPCRQSSGALYSALPRLAAAPASEALARCTHYASLGPTGIQRYFCTHCGTHVFLLDVRDGQWHACSGAIEASTSTGNDQPVSIESTASTGRGPAASTATGTTQDVVKVTGHIFVPDTIDGGVVGARLGLVQLRYGNEDHKELPCFEEWKEGTAISYASVRELAEKPTHLASPTEDESLTAKCHCGGTDLRIRRANYGQENHGVDSRHIPADPTKYTAYFCACRSCRLANGLASLQPWATIPPANITVAKNGRRVAFGPDTRESSANEGTSLAYFWSSKGVCWSFCNVCGALLAYWNEARPGVVDVAVGVLRAKEGSLARRWLSWKWGDVSFAQEAVDQQIYSAIVGEEKLE